MVELQETEAGKQQAELCAKRPRMSDGPAARHPDEERQQLLRALGRAWRWWVGWCPELANPSFRGKVGDSR